MLYRQISRVPLKIVPQSPPMWLFREPKLTTTDWDTQSKHIVRYFSFSRFVRKNEKQDNIFWIASHDPNDTSVHAHNKGRHSHQRCEHYTGLSVDIRCLQKSHYKQLTKQDQTFQFISEHWGCPAAKNHTLGWKHQRFFSSFIHLISWTLALCCFYNYWLPLNQNAT